MSYYRTIDDINKRTDMAYKESEKYGEYSGEFLIVGHSTYDEFYSEVWSQFCELCKDNHQREWKDNFDDLLKEWDQQGRCKQHGFYHNENAERLAHELYWFN